ncbi:AAA domain-containing protein [Massilia sp. Dwa41.01b]|uniref:McrB family protein n=1 Tax=unclassified Massilia TaxID=2609279 RepID=UPI0016040883|nr:MULTISPECIES: AAA family ATPase [unclassified Massilia]QNA89291.1 AAA domain-containing protein [Massilia sp. Dwa41.01b]QNB00194.1 AAA domain-containing protein [Massilia sp. Se16.2.3]
MMDKEPNEMNDMNTNPENSLAALKREWDSFKREPLKPVVEKEWRLFLDWKNSVPIAEMPLDRYTGLLDEGGQPYFTYLIERQTTHCGRFRAASSNGYGVFRTRAKAGAGAAGTLFRIAGQASAEGNAEPVSQAKAQKYFESEVRPVLVALAAYADRDDLSPLEINFARKVAYMYNPGRLLALYKGEVIRRIGRLLKLDEDELEGYKATEAIKRALTAAWNISPEDTCTWDRETLRSWGRDGDNGRLSLEFEISQKLTNFLYQRFGTTIEFEHKNTIFYGPPGTGKTHMVTEAIARRAMLEGRALAEMREIVQFHPSYSYEDFIEGLKPVPAGSGIDLVVKPGVFKLFCKRAMDALRADRLAGTAPRAFYFVVDEINRAELSRVLGEVLVCLEDSKRIDVDREGRETGLRVKTQYSYLAKEGEDPDFGVPANVVFIGTMNDIDRSIDSFDMALRRRFAWVPTACDYGVVRDTFGDHKHAQRYEEICRELNTFIREGLQLGASYEIGHAYFMKLAQRGLSAASVRDLFDTSIEPLLAEYLRAEYSAGEVKDRLKTAREIFSLSRAPGKAAPAA